MPPQLAAIICVLFILYLFWMDRKTRDGSSKALWIPLIWMFLAGSRYVSEWLDLGANIDPLDAYMEGNPLNSAVFAVLIAAGVAVLLQRRLDWGKLLVQNRWIWLYFMYCAISILWSDYPFVSFKRWIKDVGNVVMALVILSEHRPYQAVGVVLRRLAFLVVPLSVLFIKYYPDLGRAYHMGLPMFVGVSTSKNGLGAVCLLSGIYFCWRLFLNRREEVEIGGHLRVTVDIVFLATLAWLFYMANSATSYACMVVAICLFLVSRLPMLAREPRRLVTLGIITVSLIALLESTLDISDMIIAILGRDPTLTERVPMWNMLLEWDTNPYIGVGYESFWSGARLAHIWENWPGIIQSHNGYIDLYLNIGLVGLVLLLLCVISGLGNVVKHLRYEYSSAVLRISFIVVVVLYNLTEAAIKPLSNMWLVLLLSILDISNQSRKI